MLPPFPPHLPRVALPLVLAPLVARVACLPTTVDTSDSDTLLPTHLRNPKKYFMHKRLGSTPYSPVYHPPVKFIANGHPYNILVNPREYLKPQPTPAPPATSTPASTPSAPPATNSPLIWLTNTFLFNGRPSSVYRVPWAPAWRLQRPPHLYML